MAHRFKAPSAPEGFTRLPDLTQVPPPTTPGMPQLPFQLEGLATGGPVVVFYPGQTEGYQGPPVRSTSTAIERTPTSGYSTDLLPYATSFGPNSGGIGERFRGISTKRKLIAGTVALLALAGTVRFTDRGAEICEGVPVCAGSFLAPGDKLPGPITSTALLEDLKTKEKVRRLASYTIAPQGFLQWKGTDGKVNTSAVTVDITLKPDVDKLSKVGAQSVSEATTAPQYLAFLGVKKSSTACIADLQAIADTAIDHADTLAAAGGVKDVADKEFINPYMYAPYTEKPLPTDQKGTITVYASYSFTGTTQTGARQSAFTSKNAQHAVIDATNVAACLPAK